MSLDLDLLDQMRDMHLRMHRLFNNRVRERGASLAQLKLLMLIDRLGSARSTDIADTLGQAPRTVTEAIDAAQREGLVSRQPDPHDRRAKSITLTEKGRGVMNEAAPQRGAFAQEMFEAFSEPEKDALLALLKKLNMRIADMDPSAPDISAARSGQQRHSG